MAYFANGSEGSILHAQCNDCLVGEDDTAPCPVVVSHICYNYKQITLENAGFPQLREVLDLMVDSETGKCMMKAEIDKALERRKTPSAA